MRFFAKILHRIAFNLLIILYQQAFVLQYQALNYAKCAEIRLPFLRKRSNIFGNST